LTFSIVIPSYNHWDLTHSLLFDIYNNFPQDVEILVVDDCSPDAEVLKGLAWWMNGMLKGRLHVIINKENLGFLRTANLGVSKATGEMVMLVSNDVRIPDKSVVSKLKDVFGVYENPLLVGVRMLDYDTGWNTFDGKVYPYLEGWFLAFRKSEWEKFGGFDTRYTFADFEDVDISTTYRKGGGTLFALNVEMLHLGAQTYGYTAERESNTRANQIRFVEKWCKNENK
jgi:GT2 family glycosyltransferase